MSFDINEFQARYDAATTKDEKWAVMTEGVSAYGQSLAVVTAHFMECLDEEKYAEAAIHAMELSESLRMISASLPMLAITKQMRDREKE